jgi:hypothetical protein
MAKRAEYVHTGFGRWKWVDKEFCDRCGREVVVPWEAHRENGHKLFGVYECIDSGCYNAVRNGQDANRPDGPLLHFVGALEESMHRPPAAVLNGETL